MDRNATERNHSTEGKSLGRQEGSIPQFAFIIDAADYFKHVKAAMWRARHRIMLIGWDFDARVIFDSGVTVRPAGAAGQRRQSVRGVPALLAEVYLARDLVATANQHAHLYDGACDYFCGRDGAVHWLPLRPERRLDACILEEANESGGVGQARD